MEHAVHMPGTTGDHPRASPVIQRSTISRSRPDSLVETADRAAARRCRPLASLIESAVLNELVAEGTEPPEPDPAEELREEVVSRAIGVYCEAHKGDPVGFREGLYSFISEVDTKFDEALSARSGHRPGYATTKTAQE